MEEPQVYEDDGTVCRVIRKRKRNTPVNGYINAIWELDSLSVPSRLLFIALILHHHERNKSITPIFRELSINNYSPLDQCDAGILLKLILDNIGFLISGIACIKDFRFTKREMRHICGLLGQYFAYPQDFELSNRYVVDGLTALALTCHFLSSTLR